VRPIGRTGACLTPVVVAIAIAACSAGHGAPPARAHPASARASSSSPARVIIGRSVRGRPIRARELGTVRSARADLLVFGCIHGNEPAGIAVTKLLPGLLAKRSLDAWVVDDLNPDGRSLGTRQNARGVDLNRNFPWHWKTLGPRGTQQYSGTHALSEPESRAAAALIKRLRPRVTIWFHQPLGLVDQSGGSIAIERRFSRLSGLPLRRLQRYNGSVSSWQNHTFPGSTAFVVELPAGKLAPSRARTLAHAAAALLPAP
jgi:protein MpaA